MQEFSDNWRWRNSSRDLKYAAKRIVLFWNSAIKKHVLLTRFGAYQNGQKNLVAAYSVRGREVPAVAPRP